MGLASDFGLLFVLEARDRAEVTIKKADGYLNKFAGTAERTGAAAKAAGDEIDASLLKTASGADALEVATARVEAAQAKQTAATEEQAAAERNLLEVRSTGTASADELAAANDKLSAADKKAATAAKELSDAEKLQSDTAKAAAAQTGEAAAAQKKVEDASASGKSALSGVTKAAGLMGLGMAAAGYESVKMAGNFQDSTTHLVTDAGESAKQLGMVQAGILQVSSATGTSATDITNAMYHIESGGLHAQTGLNVLRIAAQGAKVGGADLDTVSKTLVGTLNAYYGNSMNAGNATQRSTQMMNELITTVSAGDMKMQDLASSLSSVAPLAAAVGIKFSQVGGAIATMTAQGMSAQQATQDLANTIRNLAKPSNTAVAEMNRFGINASDVQEKLGQRGLTGTIGALTQAITAKIPQGGAAIMSAFTQSSTAAQDLQIMLKTMPPQFASLAQGYMSGSVSAKQWRQEMSAQTPVNQHLMEQFTTLYNKSHSFNDLLAKGGPAAQTYTAALSQMMGGATGLNTALMLTGNNAGVFQDNVAKIQDAADKSGKSVDNWATIQGTFNFKMQSAKTAVQNTAIAVGTVLMPAVTSMVQAVMRVVEPLAAWTTKHQGLTQVIFGSLTGFGLLVVSIGLLTKAFKAVKGAVDAVTSVFKGIGKLFTLFSGSADAAAASADGAAASMDGLAASEDGAAASTEASTVATDANSASLIRSGLAAVGSAAKFLAVRTAQIAVTLATRAWTAAQWLFNAAMTASPILLVVAAIAALAAGVIYAYEHFAAFREIVNDVFNWLKGAVTDTIDFVKSHWELIVGIITMPIGGVALLVYKYWGQIKQYFMDAVNDIIGFLTYWFVQLPLKFAGWLANVVSTVARFVGNFMVWWLELPIKVEGAIWGFFGGLAGKFAGWVGDAATSVANKGLGIVNWWLGLPGKILNAVSGFATLLYNAGRDLVSGLINGVQNMAQSAIDSITNLGSSMLHGISSMLGIGSPSKVMADEVGKWIPAGIAQGIAANVGVLRSALTGAASLSVTTAQTVLSQSTAAQIPAAVPIAGPAFGRGGGDINIHNHFENAHFSTERDMDLLVDKIGRALAVRIGPGAGFRPNM